MKKMEKKYALLMSLICFMVSLASFTPLIFIIFNTPGETRLMAFVGALFWGTVLGIPLGITGFFMGLFYKKRKLVFIALLILSIILYVFLVLALNELRIPMGGLKG